jgi:hypothetical protein
MEEEQRPWPPRPQTTCPPARLLLLAGNNHTPSRTYTSNGIEILVAHEVHSVESELSFEIAVGPRPGSFLIVHDFAGGRELLHIAANRAEAERWLAVNHYSNARLEEVPSHSGTTITNPETGGRQE